jgi:predicted DNA-binding protein (UPF0251 family)
MIWLIREYRATLRLVERARTVAEDEQDKGNLAGAASDLRYALEYMTSGRRPGARRGVTNLTKERREISFDPQSYQFIKLAALHKKTVSSLSNHQQELLNDLLDLLTPREKQAFELVRGRGYSFEEARQTMNVTSRGTIQNLVERAELKLRFVVQKPPNSEGDNSTQPSLKKPVQRVIFADCI